MNVVIDLHPLNAAADCSESSEPRKNTILPSAKRHQCCMYIDAVLPVALTVNVQCTVATTSVSFDVNEAMSNSVTSTFAPISLKKRGTSPFPRKLPHHGAPVPAASAAQSTSSATSKRTPSMSPCPYAAYRR